MLKKNFIGPPIFLLLVALAYLGFTTYFMFAAWESVQPDLMWFVFSFSWPVLMFVETVLYWRIRKRNELHKASWVHVVLMAYAFASFFIKEWIFKLYDDFSPNMEITRFIRVVTLVHLLLFWIAIIGGHIFFFRVLRKARARKHQQPTTDPANLLDDVLS